MKIEVGKPYKNFISIVDSGGNPVTTDSPIITIRNVETKQFFNGVFFGDNEVHLQMSNEGEGRYSYTFTPDEPSIIEMNCRSNYIQEYTSHTILEVEENLSRVFEWVVDEDFEMTFQIKSSDGVFYSTIKHNNMYFDGNEFVPEERKLFIFPDNEESTNISQKFTPKNEGIYEIVYNIDGDTTEISLDVKYDAVLAKPILVNDKTLKSNTGGTSEVVDEDNKPMSGVIIKVFSKKSKKIVTTTLTRSDGSWDIIVPPGEFIFLFERDGYATVSIERRIAE